MAHRATVRAIAAGAITTFTVGAYALLTGGIATAAPGTLTWSDGATTFTRTIDNVTPVGGDVVTVSTKWARTDANWEELRTVKDFHPACLTYVPGSATVTDEGGVRGIEPYVEIQSDFIAADFTSLGYKPMSKRNVNTPVMSVQYTVGYNCARGTNFNTGMSYTGSRGPGSYPTQGPAINVAKNSPTTTLAPVAGAVTGQASTLTATITGGAAQGDTVEFYDGTTKIGTGVLDANRAATLAWTPDSAGAHTLSVKYLGTAFSNASQSADQQVTVTAPDVDSTTTLAPVSGAKVGVAGTLTATINPAGAGGTVEFSDGTAVLATVPVEADGTATTSWTPAAGGARTLTAVFSGRSGVLSSTTTQDVTVADADVTSSVVLGSVTGAKVGQASTLTATVSPAAAGGTVEFSDGTAVLATVPVAADGTASTSWTPTEGGVRTVHAVFSGRTGVLGSTTSQQVTVDAADAVSSVELGSVTGAKVGQVTTLTATVSPAAAGGTVTFKDGDIVIGTAVIGADGIAALEWTPTAAGQRVITVEFAGHGTVEAGTDHATVTVAPADETGGGSLGSLGVLFGGFGSS
ncbi:Ig-like domain-containing protein [Rhodococcus hoagii]|nr:Ig-like domain-containing protein [Prescottella equi]